MKYFYAAQSCALASESTDNGYDKLVTIRRDFKLSKEDITSHIELLDICRQNSYFTNIDAKELTIKASID